MKQGLGQLPTSNSQPPDGEILLRFLPLASWEFESGVVTLRFSSPSQPRRLCGTATEHAPAGGATLIATVQGVSVALRRGIGVVIGLLVIAVLISAAGMTFMWALVSREPAITRNSTLLLQLDTDLRESSADDVTRLFGGSAPATLGTVLEALRKAKVDPRIGAVLLAPSRLQAPLWAKVQEVRAAILDFR